MTLRKPVFVAKEKPSPAFKDPTEDLFLTSAILNLGYASLCKIMVTVFVRGGPQAGLVTCQDGYRLSRLVSGR